MKRYALIFLALMISGCSTSQLAVQATLPLVESQIMAMQEERDPDLAEKAFPASLKMLEGLLKQDPENVWILENLAEGFCGYAFSFRKTQNPIELLHYTQGEKIMLCVQRSSELAKPNGMD